VAVGVCDVGIHSYVSPIGHDSANAWPDWKYSDKGKYVRTTENFSAFAVASIPVAKFVRAHIGLGRGRFVGYDGRSRYFNTDIFLGKEHKWTIAAFGGLEVYVLPNVALVAEAGSRDMNTGVKANFGPVTAAVAWTKMEGLFFAKGDYRFGRLEFGVSCQVDNLFRRREPVCAPIEPVPPPEPSPMPTVVGPGPAGLKLSPIFFEWDKSDIMTEAVAILRENADQLKSNTSVRVMITGHASEEGTEQHNQRLSERRAAAAFEYLKSLGVPAEQMSRRGLGEEPGFPLPLHRRCDFEIVPEE
jgi:outer membrane protein OmpA-like peptidoglycan-associated protein